MAYEFTVTKEAIRTTDGPMLQPGSKLILHNPPPSAWLHAGTVTNSNAESMRLVVASPSPKKAKK